VNNALGLTLVSIVTPSLNQAEFIEETIRSVLGQDYPNIEYVVVDGGSRDRTLEILLRHEDRLRWTSGPDGGQSDAINRGFAATTGEIIAWLNADDRYLPGAIRAAAEAFMQDASIDLVYGQAVLVDRAGNRLGSTRYGEPWNLRDLVGRTNYIQQPAAFFRRAAFNAVGGLQVDLHYVMDYDLWIRLGSRGGVRFLPQVLAEVRIYPETKTASGGLQRFQEMERMIRRHGRRNVPADFEGQMLRALLQACRGSVRRGNVRETLRLLQHIAPYGSRVVWRRSVRRLRRTLGVDLR
jgi:glycosyltransferase involved in cell wall biosynthesis